MKTSTKSLAKNYARLTAEERFQLILAASSRGDLEERNRLANTGKWIEYSTVEHAPYAHAFDRISTGAYLDLLEEKEEFLEALAEVERLPKACAEDEAAWDLVWATGYLLRVKYDGWRQFCSKRHLPVDLLWQDLPGFDRLQRALELTEKARFVDEGFLRWLNSMRPADTPKHDRIPITPEQIAAQYETMFRDRVAWWNGEQGANGATGCS